MSAGTQDAGYSMSVGHCSRCGERALIGPLHGEHGGPLVCIPCGSEIHARIRKKALQDKRVMQALMPEFAPEAGEDELCAELLEDALRLCHPDRHPPERHEIAHRVTQELLALRPWVLPRAKPRDVSAVLAYGEDREVVTAPEPEQLTTALTKISEPRYPCARCRNELPMYYCAACRARWEEDIAARAERENARRRKRRAYLRSFWRQRCVGCGEVFKPRRRDARYCSHACRERAYRQRVTGKQVIHAEDPEQPSRQDLLGGAA
jgi:hypothetical protein